MTALYVAIAAWVVIHATRNIYDATREQSAHRRASYSANAALVCIAILLLSRTALRDIIDQVAAERIGIVSAALAIVLLLISGIIRSPLKR